ncbi:MAG: ABC transporter ATP-binding protein [Hamadaea sp.]|nr:ABC transporter ATP-binding protein [Hamadaea sp.]NUR49598.1 ABC transporter ATP-binding protein [Hamadaea sp.]NUT06425.1 ABC transporter ATP-binding protein [Hamadaea sp.]
MSPTNWLAQRITERWKIVRLAGRAGPGLVAGLLLINLALGVLPVLFVVATGVVIGRVPAAVQAGVPSSEWTGLLKVFLLGAAAFVAQQLLAPIVTLLRELAARRVDGLLLEDLMAASLRSPGISALEDQDTLDDLRNAARQLEFGFQSPGQAVPGLFALVARYTALLGFAIVVGVVFSWLAAAALVTAVLVFRYCQRGGLRKYVKVRFDTVGAHRKLDYVRGLAVDSGAGKEIRVFGLLVWLRQQLREAYDLLLRDVRAARRRVYLWPFIWATLWGLAVSVAVFATFGTTAVGGLSLTEFVLVVQSILGALRLSEYYAEADSQTCVGMYGYEALQRFTDRIDAAAPPAAVRAAPAPISEIRFENVTFHYPGQATPVLDGLTLTIPIGQCTALVGLNGAGKTTVVKLLARLYEPTGGAILADGIDIRAYAHDEWRARLGVIFQEFARFEASIADNIGFGSVAAKGDRDGVRQAAEAIGLGDTIAALPNGLDTPLARHLSGGVDLSGGQWQRVALARALFALRHGTTVVILDEPTASLDVRAEAQFFDEFAALTQGATTLLISHRFSTVRRADQIVVLDGGSVLEQGTHEELMALDGRYAGLFSLQADRFVDATTGVPTDTEVAA